MLPPRLEAEIEILRRTFTVNVREDPDIINVVLESVPTSSLFNNPTTTVLIRVPKAYPDAGPDMFWTDPGLLLADGTVASASDAMENYAERSWRRFSWHHQSWNPNHDDLVTYVEFVRRRFNAR